MDRERKTMIKERGVTEEDRRRETVPARSRDSDLDRR